MMILTMDILDKGWGVFEKQITLQNFIKRIFFKMISFEPLINLIKKERLNIYEILKDTSISPLRLRRFLQSATQSDTEVVACLCSKLHCQPSDIMTISEKYEDCDFREMYYEIGKINKVKDKLKKKQIKWNKYENFKGYKSPSIVINSLLACQDIDGVIEKINLIITSEDIKIAELKQQTKRGVK